ncbi:MAG TPA: SDR family oxidoreductase [Spongiibacteraceae bacterium]|jgi:short-subunit dehydrogenase|nr:SDR family oxidoreductase [Spongiibacteraceae bacterium]HUH37561.1 SDR family oxidoreductase [Spongiibacteraceae bacterium]
MKIEHRTAVLTGATGGIGTAIAKALDTRGAHLLLVGRREQALYQLNRSLGERHTVIVADIATVAGRETVVAAAAADCSVLINAAGTQPAGMLAVQREPTISRSLDINLCAPVLLTHALLPQLLAQKQAAIVNIGSVFGSIGYPGFSVYCAAKFGLHGFSEALARELADTAVDVFYLAPRATRTTFNSSAVDALNAELGNTLDPPERVASALLAQLEYGRRRAFLGWPEKVFVPLNALLPALVDRALKKQLPKIKRYLA